MWKGSRRSLTELLKYLPKWNKRSFFCIRILVKFTLTGCKKKKSWALKNSSDLSGDGQVALEGPPGLGPQLLSLPEFPTGMGDWRVFEVRSKLRGSFSCGSREVCADWQSTRTAAFPADCQTITTLLFTPSFSGFNVEIHQ